MDTSRTLAIIILSATAVSARVIANATNVEPAFKAEPLGRGTTSLVTNCLVTYFFCVWTAVHPNIIPKPTIMRTSIYKVTLMIFCIFVAETSIMPAYSQWKAAKQIRKLWLTKFDISKGDPNDIGMEGGFFVVMGGVGVGELNDDGKCRSILTTAGFEECLNNGKLRKTDLIRDDIIDKGKANMIVKLLVFAQATWFVFAFMGRLSTEMPVTMLELHVVIQVVNALLASCFWFRKPMDVEQPIHLKHIPTYFQLSKPANDSETRNTVPDVEEPIYLTHTQSDPQLSKPLNNHSEPVPETTKFQADLNCITEDGRSSFVTEILRAISSTGEPILGDQSKRLYAVAGMMAFNGACHAAAYLIQFPSEIERTLWMISSLTLCVVPFVMACILQHGDYLNACYELVWDERFTDHNNPFHHVGHILIAICKKMYKVCASSDTAFSVGWFLMMPLRFLGLCITFGLCVVYLICVFYIVFESGFSLRSLAVGSYSAPVWSNYVPQIA